MGLAKALKHDIIILGGFRQFLLNEIRQKHKCNRPTPTNKNYLNPTNKNKT